MSTLYFPQALSRLLAESYHKDSGSNSEEVGEEGGAVLQGVAISTIWAIAAETKHSRRQFQEKNCQCAEPWEDRLVKNTSSVILSKTWNKP